MRKCKSKIIFGTTPFGSIEPKGVSILEIKSFKKMLWFKKAGILSFLLLLLAGVVINLSYAATIEVHPGESIQEAIDQAVSGDTVFVFSGIYAENIIMKSNVDVNGDSSVRVILKGRIIFKDANCALKSITLLFPESAILSYVNSYYTDFKLEADAGITAINSAPEIHNCVIKPDLEAINDLYPGGPSLEHYGKAIQVWNMYGAEDRAPQIEGNLIQDTDCGIYYFSQVFGGAISGSIKNNTFYHNKDGIILRMHKENPHIYNNIFDNSGDAAIFLTYEDGELFTRRKAGINNNLFNQNADNFRLDSSMASFDLIDIQGNVEDDPLFIDPAGGNFYLEPASPALTGGEGGALMGAYAEFVSQLFIKITSPQDGITIYARP